MRSLSRRTRLAFGRGRRAIVVGQELCKGHREQSPVLCIGHSKLVATQLRIALTVTVRGKASAVTRQPQRSLVRGAIEPLIIEADETPLGLQATTATPSVVRSRRRGRRPTSRPSPTGDGSRASPPSCTRAATPSSGCSGASRTSAASPPDTTGWQPTTWRPSASPLPSATGYESGA